MKARKYFLIIALAMSSVAKADYDSPSSSKESAIKGSGASRQEFDRRMSGRTGFENTLQGIQNFQREMQEAEANDAREEAARKIANKKAADAQAEKDDIYAYYGEAMVDAMISNNEEVLLNSVDGKPSIWMRAFSLVLSRSEDGTTAQDVSRIRALQGLLAFKVIPTPPRDYGEMYATGLYERHLEEYIEKVDDIIEAEEDGEFNDRKRIYTPEAAYILGKLYMYGYQHRKDKDKDYVIEPDEKKAFAYFKLSASYMNLKLMTSNYDNKSTVTFLVDEKGNSVAPYMNNMIIHSAYEVIRCYRDGVGTKKDLAMAQKTASDLFEKFEPFYKNRPADFLVNTSAFKASHQYSDDGAGILKRSGYSEVIDIVGPEYRKIYYAEGSENRKAEIRQQEAEKKKLEEEQRKQAEEKRKRDEENEKIALIEKAFSEPAYLLKKEQAAATIKMLTPSVFSRVRGNAGGQVDSYFRYKYVQPSLETSEQTCVTGKCYCSLAGRCDVYDDIPNMLVYFGGQEIGSDDPGRFVIPALVVLSEEIGGLLEDDFKAIPKTPQLAESLFLDLEKIDDSSEYMVSALDTFKRDQNLFRPRIYFRLFQIYNDGIGVAKNRTKAESYLSKCISHAKAQSEPGGNGITHPTARIFSAFCAMEAAKNKPKSSEMIKLAAKVLYRSFGRNRNYYESNYKSFAYNSVKDILEPEIDALIGK
jgi:hypothetical protein